MFRKELLQRFSRTSRRDKKILCDACDTAAGVAKSCGKNQSGKRIGINGNDVPKASQKSLAKDVSPALSNDDKALLRRVPSFKPRADTFSETTPQHRPVDYRPQMITQSSGRVDDRPQHYTHPLKKLPEQQWHMLRQWVM